MSVADQLEELDLQPGAGARSHPGDEPERLSQHTDRVPVCEAHPRVLCREDQVADRPLVVAAALEVQSELGGLLLLSSGRGAQTQELLSELPVKPGPAGVREPAIDHFPIERMSELVMGRIIAVHETFAACRFDRSNQLLPPRQTLAQLFDPLWLEPECAGERPGREPGPGRTGPPPDALRIPLPGLRLSF